MCGLHVSLQVAEGNEAAVAEGTDVLEVSSAGVGGVLVYEVLGRQVSGCRLLRDCGRRGEV